MAKRTFGRLIVCAVGAWGVLALHAPVSAAEGDSLEARVTAAFEVVADYRSEETQRKEAREELRALSKSERREAARVLLPYLDTIHIYEQLALPRAYRALGKSSVPALIESGRTA